MILGFTGTQKGMTGKQVEACLHLLRDLQEQIVEIHHGDCIGADEQFVLIATEMQIPNIVCHPPLNKSKRAYVPSNKTLPGKAYLERNRDIVDAADILIATPSRLVEELRSGTWATIRYARKKKRPIVIIYPNGAVEWEE